MSPASRRGAARRPPRGRAPPRRRRSGAEPYSYRPAGVMAAPLATGGRRAVLVWVAGDHLFGPRPSSTLRTEPPAPQTFRCRDLLSPWGWVAVPGRLLR